MTIKVGDKIKISSGEYVVNKINDIAVEIIKNDIITIVPKRELVRLLNIDDSQKLEDIFK